MSEHIGEHWRYTLNNDNGAFALATIDVDADDEGRTKDFGQHIADGIWEGSNEQLWAAVATPVILDTLQIAAQHLIARQDNTLQPIIERIMRAVVEATTDPNTPDPDDRPY